RYRRDCDRILDQDRRLRNQELHGLTMLLREDRLVLVREERVAAAGEERLQPLTRAAGLCDDVLPHLGEERLRLLRCLPGAERAAVGRRHVPARTASAARGGG